MNVVTKKTVELAVAPEFLWFVLSLLIVFFIIVALILTYHWKSYGIEHNPKIFAKSIFWIVSIALIIIMTFAITGFEYL